MARASVARRLVLLGLSAVLLVTAGFFVFLGVKASHRSGRIESATRAIAAGNWAGARETLLWSLAEDPNSERALALLAEIAVHEDNPPDEVYYLSRLVRLNEFERKYATAFREALLKARNFSGLASVISKISVYSRTPEEDAWLAYSQLATGDEDAARETWRAARELRHEGGGTIADFVTFILGDANRAPADMEAGMRKFAESADEHVRLEALLALAGYLDQSDRAAEAKERLLTAEQMDSYAAVPELVQHDLRNGQLESAIARNGVYLKKYPSVANAVRQGEWLASVGRTNEIQELSTLFPVGTYNAMVLMSYFDALTAFAAGDGKTLVEALEPTRATFRSPWSRLMAIEADIVAAHSDCLQVLAEDYRDLLQLPPFADCRERAFARIKAFIGQQITAGRPVKEFLGLVAALQEGLPEEDGQLARIALLGGLQSGAAGRREVESALTRHPNDGGIVAAAAEFALASNDPERAVELSARLGAHFTNSTAVANLVMRAVFALSEARTNDVEAAESASRALRQCLATSPSPRALAACWRHAEALRRPADLTALRDASAEYAPFCAVVLDLLAGHREAALDQLEKSTSENPDLVYWSAMTLAEADRNAAAIQKYESLPADYPNRLGVLLNLSELYAAEGNAEKAMSLARTAWTEAPQNAFVRTCYERRLAESKKADPE